MATIPDAALVNNAKILGGVSGGAAYTHIAVGSGSTAEANADTTLVTELTLNGFARAAATVTYEATAKCKWTKTFTATADSNTVREFAIFNDSSGGDMGLRHVMAANKVLDNTETFTATVIITCARAA
jgi:hypothetical protein